MSKSQPRAPKASAPTRKHLARAQRERIVQRWITGVVLGLLAVVAGLVAYPLIVREFVQPAQPVAQVNGEAVTTRDFQKRVRYARVQLILQYWNLVQVAQFFGNDPQFAGQLNEVTALLNSNFALGRDTLDQLIEERLIRQEAARRGLSVSAAELDEEIQRTFRFYPEGTPTPLPSLTPAPSITPLPTGTPDPDATATPAPTTEPSATPLPTETATSGPSPTASPVPSITPTATPFTRELFERDLRDFVNQQMRLTGMSEAEVRALFETQILRRKLSDVWEAEPQVASVHARHILAPDEATARDVLRRLAAGESFVDLAAEVSLDTSNSQVGGDLGFFGRGQMVPEFEAAAFDNPVGLVPEPVETTFGWHVIEVLDTRLEDMEDAQGRELAAWLDTQRNDPMVVQTFDYWEERVPDEPRFNPQVPPTAFPTSAP